MGVSCWILDVARVDGELGCDGGFGDCVGVDEEFVEFVRGAGNWVLIRFGVKEPLRKITYELCICILL